MHLHLDAIGGIAGDMFNAALLDAFPRLREGVFAAVRTAGLPAGVELSLVAHRDHALGGSRFVVGDTPKGHHRHHTPFARIREMLDACALPAGVRAHAIAIFTLLAQAEADVHGATVETIEFHEIGAWDSIADIVGAAYLIAELNASWSCGALPIGSGRVKSAHGLLPVPAPATVRLLEGFECVDDGVGGERVTPTGAAILRYLRANFGGVRRGRVGVAGIGFGSRQLPGLSNVLRVLSFDTGSRGLDPDCATQNDRVAEILFEVDDQTPEDLAIGLDRIRAHPGTRDVLQAPVFGKKGRLAVQVRVLADPAALDAITDLCLSETATIGLRYQTLDRRTLRRRQRSIAFQGKEFETKEVERAGDATRKVEADDLRGVAGYAARERIRREIGKDGS